MPSAPNSYTVARFWLLRAWNALRGYGFGWEDGALTPRRGTCPYPTRKDWSARACIKAGDCGCDEQEAP